MAWPADVKVAVNLSPVQFKRGNLVDTVIYALSETGLPPHRLQLEVTESVLLEKSADNLSTMHQLRQFGVGIVLDDFGTGFSSLLYLQQFPFDKIKIDRSFVSELPGNTNSAAIICAVNGLARGLNIGTLAEGVETQEQCELLKLAGCNEAQGFLFGKPMPTSALDFAALKQQAKPYRAA
jgi:EAL domain-containing protein (putative c-di-GMP-specific phosphodiesterase class I)